MFDARMTTDTLTAIPPQDFSLRHAHRAPIPEEEPIPGEEPAPDEEEPTPHPDPVMEPLAIMPSA